MRRGGAGTSACPCGTAARSMVEKSGRLESKASGLVTQGREGESIRNSGGMLRKFRCVVNNKLRDVVVLHLLVTSSVLFRIDRHYVCYTHVRTVRVRRADDSAVVSPTARVAQASCSDVLCAHCNVITHSQIIIAFFNIISCQNPRNR